MLDPWGLRPIQSLICSAFFEHKHLLVMLPRQEGKTELGCRLGKHLINLPKSHQGLFLTKSREAAKKMTREKYMRLFEQDRFAVNTEIIYNREYPQACIYIDSADKRPDKLRGGTYHFIHWAEVAFAQFDHGITIHDFLAKIIRPTQRQTNGYSYLESTANGANEWKELWFSAKENGFKALSFSLSQLVDMGLRTEQEYLDIKKVTPDLVFRQEYECEFVTFEGLIFDEFKPHHIWSEMPPPDSWQICVFAIDWGYDPSATCVLFGYVLDGVLCVFDEIYDKKMLIDDIKRAIKEKFNLWAITRHAGVADHDPRNIEELIREGIEVENSDKTNVLGARLEIKSAFLNDKIFIHPRCKMLIKDLLAANWSKKKHGEMDDKMTPWGHYDGESTLRYLMRSLKVVEAKQSSTILFPDTQRALESALRSNY